MDKHLDPIRRKLVEATPEEAVRQELVAWLHERCGVPLHLMETECSLSNFQAQVPGRVDVLVHGVRQGNARRPWLLAECKRPGESDWMRLEVQVNRYLRVLQPNFLLLQIGAERRIYQMNWNLQNKAQPTAISDLPHFPSGDTP